MWYTRFLITAGSLGVLWVLDRLAKDPPPPEPPEDPDRPCPDPREDPNWEAPRPVPDRDPWVVLGLRSNATPADVRRAYLRLAKKHHPDKNPGDKASEWIFREVRQAYDILRERLESNNVPADDTCYDEGTFADYGYSAKDLEDLRFEVARRCPQVQFDGRTERGARVGQYNFRLISGRLVCVQAPRTPTGELRQGTGLWRFHLTGDQPESGSAATLSDVVDWICARARATWISGKVAAYYVYENYPTDRAIVHAASCGFCNDGRGRKGRPVTPNGRWHGPFSTKGAAEEAAKGTGRSWWSHGCV